MALELRSELEQIRRLWEVKPMERSEVAVGMVPVLEPELAPLSLTDAERLTLACCRVSGLLRALQTANRCNALCSLEVVGRKISLLARMIVDEEFPSSVN